MKKFLIGLFIGLVLGWVSLGLAQASDNDAKTYKDLLRKIILLVEQVKATSQITTDNTTALRKKLGAE